MKRKFVLLALSFTKGVYFSKSQEEHSVCGKKRLTEIVTKLVSIK